MSIFIFRRFDFTNINRVYECELWIILDKDVDILTRKASFKLDFLKKTLVYVSNSDCYYDLSTKMYYPVDYRLFSRGQIFIKPDTLVPVSTLIDTKYDNIPKTRILKKYKKQNGGKNEYK